ncbi:hypothetical protein BOTBODRAFT_482585 [Botryobasidium botryosum FD-172 SS1]|uniref:Uncharacterized protein n=1 Tax=Botryobasidium botryosum (strain FD-172 SS1) TaxID=930990 RepID=A0A067MWH5_BOTB1|nr:hypothetical protein BOTBODRAFT_482585 [Botryobasidium botryosum FD-172 SS1]
MLISSCLRPPRYLYRPVSRCLANNPPHPSSPLAMMCDSESSAAPALRPKGCLCLHRSAHLHKSVSFNADPVQDIFEVDEWDRSSVPPTPKLTYRSVLLLRVCAHVMLTFPRRDILELKQLKLDLLPGMCPNANGKHRLPGVPIALCPLLPAGNTPASSPSQELNHPPLQSASLPATPPRSPAFNFLPILNNDASGPAPPHAFTAARKEFKLLPPPPFHSGAFPPSPPHTLCPPSPTSTPTPDSTADARHGALPPLNTSSSSFSPFSITFKAKRSPASTPTSPDIVPEILHAPRSRFHIDQSLISFKPPAFKCKNLQPPPAITTPVLTPTPSPQPTGNLKLPETDAGSDKDKDVVMATDEDETPAPLLAGIDVPSETDAPSDTQEEEVVPAPIPMPARTAPPTAPQTPSTLFASTSASSSSPASPLLPRSAASSPVATPRLRPASSPPSSTIMGKGGKDARPASPITPYSLSLAQHHQRSGSAAAERCRPNMVFGVGVAVVGHVSVNSRHA